MKFQGVRDGTERNPPNPTYTCAVRMERKGEYINEKKSMKEGIGTEKERKTRDVNKREEREKRKKELY